MIGPLRSDHSSRSDSISHTTYSTHVRWQANGDHHERTWSLTVANRWTRLAIVLNVLRR
jgi:hypothetical protein